MAKTLRDRYIEALERRGCKRVTETKRYVILTRPAHPGTFYFVGQAGAIRFGRTASTSHATNDVFKERLLAAPAVAEG